MVPQSLGLEYIKSWKELTVNVMVHGTYVKSDLFLPRHGLLVIQLLPLCHEKDQIWMFQAQFFYENIVY